MQSEFGICPSPLRQFGLCEIQPTLTRRTCLTLKLIRPDKLLEAMRDDWDLLILLVSRG
jgi:hypothetical protein